MFAESFNLIQMKILGPTSDSVAKGLENESWFA